MFLHGIAREQSVGLHGHHQHLAVKHLAVNRHVAELLVAGLLMAVSLAVEVQAAEQLVAELEEIARPLVNVSDV